MSDGVLTRILRRCTWAAWVLVFCVVFAQPAWGYSLAAMAPSAKSSLDGGWTDRLGSAPLSVLPAWFVSAEPSRQADPFGFVQTPIRPFASPASYDASSNASSDASPLVWLKIPTKPHSPSNTPSLSKSAAVITATLDQPIAYTLVYTIPDGTLPASFTLADTVPSAPDLVFDTSPGSYSGPAPLNPDTPPMAPITPTFSNFNRTATWALGVLSNTSGYTYAYAISYQATVRGGSWGNLATNDAHLSYDGNDIAASRTITIFRPDMYTRLRAAASNGDWGAAPREGAPDSLVQDLVRGDVITFTLYVTNANPAVGWQNRWPYLSPAYDMRFHFELPNFLQYVGPVGTTPNPVQTPGPNGWTFLDWQGFPELASLGAHDSLAFVIRATVNTTVTANRDEAPLHRVYYRYQPGGAREDSVSTGGVFGLRLRSRTLSLAKSASVNGLLVAEQVTYTIRFTMPDGVSINTPIYLEDEMQDGLDWARSLSATPQFSATPDVSRPANNIFIQWDWTGSHITGPGVYSFTFVAALSSTLKNGSAIPWATRFNRAGLYWDDAFGDPRSVNAGVVLVQVIRPFIPPEKEVWDGSGWRKDLNIKAGGEQMRFRIRGQNSQTGILNEPINTSAAYEIVISDTLPAGFTLQQAFPTLYLTTTVNGRTLITWGPYISVAPGAELPIHYITATAPITLTPDPSSFYENLPAVHYSDRPGSPPDDNVYVTIDTDIFGNPRGARVHTRDMIKVTKYADPSGNAVRVGDVVTFTIVAEIASGSTLYGPFFTDQAFNDGMVQGYHYISGTFDITGAAASPVTIPWGAREIVSWSLPSPYANVSGSPHLITSSFQVRFTGVDLNGSQVFPCSPDLAQCRDPVFRARTPNGARLYWHLEEQLINLREPSNRVDANLGIIQPLLVDPNFAPVKTLVGGGPGPVESGDLLTYTLNVYNTGWASAYDVILNDRLPTGVQVLTYSAGMFNQWAGQTYTVTFSAQPTSGDTGTIGWVVDELKPSNNNANQPTQLLLTYTVGVMDNAGAGATLINSAWISDYTSLPGAQPFERHYSYMPGIGVPVSAQPVSVSEAQISKSASVTEVAIGGIVVFTVTAPAPMLGATVYNATITDSMPSAPPGPLQVLTATAPGATFLNITSDTVSAGYISVTAYAQERIIITARVPSTATSGRVGNDVDVTWTDAASGGNTHTASSAPVTVTIIGPDVTVIKDAPAMVLPGYPLVYTMTYRNIGAADAARVTLTDTLPNSVKYDGFASDRLVTPTGFVPAPLVWDLGNLSAGESGTIWVTTTVWVTTPLGSSLVNTATVSTASPGDGLHNNQDTASTAVGGVLGLAINKVATPDPVASGGLVRYTLTVSNVGDIVALGVVVTDRVPSNTVYHSASPGGSLMAGNVVSWTPTDVDVGSQVVLTFAVRVDSGLVSGTQIVNDEYGAMSGNDAPVVPILPVAVTVHDARLAMGKVARPDPVQAGDLLRYTLTISNPGDVEALGIVVTDRVPLSTTFSSASAGGVLVAGNVVSWTPSGILPGGSTVLAFTVRVDSPLVSGALIVNDAYGVVADNAASPPTDPVTVTVYSQPVLSVQKTAAATVDAGEDLEYTIRYRNSGNAIATGVRITDSYDANVTFVGATPAPDVGNNVWQVGPLTPTMEHTIVITVHVGDSVANGTLLTNTVVLDSRESVPLSDTVTTLVGGFRVYIPVMMKNYTPPVLPDGVNLVVESIQVGPLVPTVGQSTSITVTLRNLGADPVVDDFWVDLYIDPITTPTINVIWNDIAPYGKAWFIRDDIAGDGTLVINTNQPDDPLNPGELYSNWPGWFVSSGEHVLYVQADALGDAWGLVLEFDETDNVGGPVTVAVVPSDTLAISPPPVLLQKRR